LTMSRISSLVTIFCLRVSSDESVVLRPVNAGQCRLLPASPLPCPLEIVRPGHFFYPGRVRAL
jgi:hypothetical protein